MIDSNPWIADINLDKPYVNVCGNTQGSTCEQVNASNNKLFLEVGRVHREKNTYPLIETILGWLLDSWKVRNACKAAEKAYMAAMKKNSHTGGKDNKDISSKKTDSIDNNDTHIHIHDACNAYCKCLKDKGITFETKIAENNIYPSGKKRLSIKMQDRLLNGTDMFETFNMKSILMAELLIKVYNNNGYNKELPCHLFDDTGIRRECPDSAWINALIDQYDYDCKYQDFAKEVNKWQKEEIQHDRSNTENIQKAAARMKECYLQGESIRKGQDNKADKKATILNLEGFELKTIPACLKNLKYVKTMNLSHNKLTDIPAEIFDMSLESLNLRYNQLTKLPSIQASVKCTSSLKKINLTDNEFEELPSSLFELNALKNLELRNNRLKELTGLKPGHWPDLDILRLDNNQFTEIPKELQELEAFHQNQYTQEEYAHEKSKKKTLSITKNLLNNLEGLLKLKGLNELWLDGNPLGESNIDTLDAKGVQGMDNLHVLSMEDTGLKTVPRNLIENLAHLWYLYLSNNKISELNGVHFGNELTILHLANNQFTEIPEAVITVPYLQELDMSGNRVNRIPAFKSRILMELRLAQPDSYNGKMNELNVNDFPLDSIQELTRLDLSHNRLVGDKAQVDDFTKGIFNLEKLKELRLNQCDIDLANVKVSGVKMKHLKEVVLTGNRLDDDEKQRFEQKFWHRWKKANGSHIDYTSIHIPTPVPVSKIGSPQYICNV